MRGLHRFRVAIHEANVTPVAMATSNSIKVNPRILEEFSPKHIFARCADEPGGTARLACLSCAGVRKRWTGGTPILQLQRGRLEFRSKRIRHDEPESRVGIN